MCLASFSLLSMCRSLDASTLVAGCVDLVTAAGLAVVDLDVVVVVFETAAAGLGALAAAAVVAAVGAGLTAGDGLAVAAVATAGVFCAATAAAFGAIGCVGPTGVMPVSREACAYGDLAPLDEERTIG